MRSVFFATALATCYLGLTSAQSISTTQTLSATSTTSSISWDFSSTPSGYQIGGTQGASILSAWDAAHPEESYWATQTGTVLRNSSTETPGRVWMGSTVGVAEETSSVESSATASGTGATAAGATETGTSGTTGNTTTTEDTASSGASSVGGATSWIMAVVFGRAAFAMGEMGSF